MAAWKDLYIFTAYDLARGGYTQNQIAKAIGVDPATFSRWKKTHIALRQAVRKGHGMKNGNQPGKFTFRDYVYQRLPDNLQKMWDCLVKMEDAKTGVAKIEAFLEKQGKRARQHLFMHAWTSGNFSLTAACRRVNISKYMFRTWLDDDPDFASLVDTIDEMKKDFFEEHLCMLIQGGDSPATIFANRTYNADRGYSEKMKVETEVVNTQINVIKIENLNMSTEEKRELLQKVRQARKQVESREVVDA